MRVPTHIHAQRFYFVAIIALSYAILRLSVLFLVSRGIHADFLDTPFCNCSVFLVAVPLYAVLNRIFRVRFSLDSDLPMAAAEMDRESLEKCKDEERQPYREVATDAKRSVRYIYSYESHLRRSTGMRRWLPYLLYAVATIPGISGALVAESFPAATILLSLSYAIVIPFGLFLSRLLPAADPEAMTRV